MSFEIVYSSLPWILLWSFYVSVMCISGSAFLALNMLCLHLKLTLFLLLLSTVSLYLFLMDVLRHLLLGTMNRFPKSIGHFADCC